MMKHQIRMMKQKNYQCAYLTLQLCYIASPWAHAHVYSSHCFLQNSAVCVFVSPNSDVSSSVWPRVTPACQASVDERKETNWCSWETSVKYCPPVSNFYIVRVLKKNKHSTVVCGGDKIINEGCCKFLVQLVEKRKILQRFVSWQLCINCRIFLDVIFLQQPDIYLPALVTLL